jgi:hypothetical protein
MVARMPASGKQECTGATLTRSANGFNPFLWNFLQTQPPPARECFGFRLHAGFDFLAAQTSGYDEGSHTIARTLCKVSWTLGQASDIVPRREQESRTSG